MKKLLCLMLSILLICGSISPVSVFALGDDVDMDMGIGGGDENTIASTESGTDAGSITKSGDYYTAVPYKGNEFIGWYDRATDELYSTEATEMFTEGSYIAKFEDNNIAYDNAGYELYENGVSAMPAIWKTAADQSWRKASISNEFAKSGEKSVYLPTPWQHDVYTEFTGLEKNSYYVVSYSWMLTHSAITDTNTTGDAYYGSAIGTAEAESIEQAYQQALGGDYTGIKNQTYTGGQWNDVEYVFYTGDQTTYRMFFFYVNTGASDKYEASPTKMFVDELTVYRPDDQASVATYKATVSAENGYAYALTNGPVKTGTEVTVVATPFGGYTFDGWYEGDVKVSSDKIYTFNIEANRNLVAKCVLATEAGGEFVPDVNMDGDITLDDVVLIAQKIADWDVTVNSEVIDVNGDDKVNLDDVVLLAQYVAGWDVEDKFASGGEGESVLPDEDLNDAALKSTLLAGNSTYYNESTIVNEGNMTRVAKVLKKAQNGEDITIVAFGGSITYGAKATTEANRYANKVATWFEDTFNINVNFINAGIGSTTSMVGIHRMDLDVLAHDPDLVLVDFTTNDGDNDPKYQIPYENLIRRLLTHETEPAVMAVIFGDITNYSASGGSGYNVRQDNAISAHLPSLIYYDIPTIDYYGQLWRYIDAGVIKWTDVGADEVHPSDNGHHMASKAISYYLEKVLAQLDTIDTTTLPAIPEDYLFGSDVYQNATFLSASNTTPDAMTNMEVGQVHAKVAYGWVCTNEAGGSITIKAKQITAISIFLENKVGNGLVNININGTDVVKGLNTNSSSTGYMWYAYHDTFDAPMDVTITISSSGKFGTGPIGVAY